MILKAFCVFDKAITAYGRPFFELSAAAAVRAFRDACRDKDTGFAKHPEDYILFACGDFDDSLGIFRECEPNKLVTAIECVSDEDIEVSEEEANSRMNKVLRQFGS